MTPIKIANLIVWSMIPTALGILVCFEMYGMSGEKYLPGLIIGGLVGSLSYILVAKIGIGEYKLKE